MNLEKCLNLVNVSLVIWLLLGLLKELLLAFHWEIDSLENRFLGRIIIRDQKWVIYIYIQRKRQWLVAN